MTVGIAGHGVIFLGTTVVFGTTTGASGKGGVAEVVTTTLEDGVLVVVHVEVAHDKETFQLPVAIKSISLSRSSSSLIPDKFQVSSMIVSVEVVHETIRALVVREKLVPILSLENVLRS